jgi:5-(carboxyamino)imidazole ribonucleotide mutase
MEDGMVAIIMGSGSDLPQLEGCAQLLDSLGIEWESRVLSAHRTPEALDSYIAGLEKRGCQVIIAAAGLSAHLPGVIAAKTLIPVVGVPLKAKTAAMEGMDAVMSMLQMPPGIPVATVGIDNGTNGALLAAAIIGSSDTKVRKALAGYRSEKKEKLLTQYHGEVLK